MRILKITDRITKKFKLYAYKKNRKHRTFSLWYKDKDTGRRRLHRGHHGNYPFIKIGFWELVLWIKNSKDTKINMPEIEEIK